MEMTLSDHSANTEDIGAITEQTSSCVLCDVKLTNSNDSKEHIIPNSIGGRKKISGFICRDCNAKCGETWDGAPAEQLNPLCLLLKIKRDRGDAPSQNFETTGGERIRLRHDGSVEMPKPSIHKTLTGDQVTVDIRARSIHEARNIIEGLKKKHPKINVEKALNDLEDRAASLEHPLKMSFSFGGLEVGRSLVKSALALAFANGINPKSCTNAMAYLRDDKAEACFGYYFESDLIINRPRDRVFHCVGINGSVQTGLLLGYIEFFCAQRIVVCLSDSYDGPDVHDIYVVDPVSGIDIHLQFQMPLTREDIAAVYLYEKIPLGSMEEAFKAPLILARQADLKRENDRIIEQAVEYGFKNCGAAENEELTEEQMRILSSLTADKLVELLRPRIRRRA